MVGIDVGDTQRTAACACPSASSAPTAPAAPTAAAHRQSPRPSPVRPADVAATAAALTTPLLLLLLPLPAASSAIAAHCIGQPAPAAAAPGAAAASSLLLLRLLLRTGGCRRACGSSGLWVSTRCGRVVLLDRKGAASRQAASQGASGVCTLPTIAVVEVPLWGRAFPQQCGKADVKEVSRALSGRGVVAQAVT